MSKSWCHAHACELEIQVLTLLYGREAETRTRMWQVQSLLRCRLRYFPTNLEQAEFLHLEQAKFFNLEQVGVSR